MNILVVNSVFTGGGAEKVARQLYYGLSGKNDINTFFVAGRSSRASDEIIEIYDYNKTWIQLFNRTKNLLSNNARKKDNFSRKLILAYIKNYNIDIVHFHNIHGNYIGIEDIGEISRYCKVIWTLHDMWALTGHCAYALRCKKWINSNCEHCTDLRLYPQMFMNKAYKICKLKQKCFTGKSIIFVTPSQWLMKQCNRTYLADEQKYLIRNGVNTDIFCPLDKQEIRKKYQISERKIILCFAANSIKSPYKGAHVLQEALKLVKEKKNYELVIVGKDEVGLFEGDFKCHYMGYVNDDNKMNELYNLADVFILPSIAENFPCSVLESMSAGTPVIGSRTGGIVEQIDEKTGWLFDTGNSGQLAEIINVIPAKMNELHAMGNLCREKVIKEFSEEKMLNEYQELYNNISLTL